MNVQDLVHPDDDFTREWLDKAEWDYAQRQLDNGELESDVCRRLHDWARDRADEVEAECAEYAATVALDHQ